MVAAMIRTVFVPRGRRALVEGQIDDQANATGLPVEKVMSEVILKRPAIKELV